MSEDKWTIEIKKLFRKRLELLSQETREKVYYTYLEEILSNSKWFEAVCTMLQNPTADGFVRLVPDHIDLTLEYIVINNEDYRKLFSSYPEVIEACNFKLQNPEQVKQLAKETNKKY